MTAFVKYFRFYQRNFTNSSSIRDSNTNTNNGFKNLGTTQLITNNSNSKYSHSGGSIHIIDNRLENGRIGNMRDNNNNKFNELKLTTAYWYVVKQLLSWIVLFSFLGLFNLIYVVEMKSNDNNSSTVLWLTVVSNCCLAGIGFANGVAWYCMKYLKARMSFKMHKNRMLLKQQRFEKQRQDQIDELNKYDNYNDDHDETQTQTHTQTTTDKLLKRFDIHGNVINQNKKKNNKNKYNKRKHKKYKKMSDSDMNMNNTNDERIQLQMIDINSTDDVSVYTGTFGHKLIMKNTIRNDGINDHGNGVSGDNDKYNNISGNININDVRYNSTLDITTGAITPATMNTPDFTPGPEITPFNSGNVSVNTTIPTDNADATSKEINSQIDTTYDDTAKGVMGD